MEFTPALFGLLSMLTIVVIAGIVGLYNANKYSKSTPTQ